MRNPYLWFSFLIFAILLGDGKDRKACAISFIRPRGLCVSDGSCTAAAPACGQTTFGTDNCGAPCSKSGPIPAAPSALWSEPITENATKIRKIHIDELRTQINLIRASLCMANYSWTGAGSGKISGLDFQELRAAIEDVYKSQSVALPSPWLAPVPLTAGVNIKKGYISELRTAAEKAPNINSDCASKTVQGTGAASVYDPTTYRYVRPGSGSCSMPNPISQGSGGEVSHAQLCYEYLSNGGIIVSQGAYQAFSCGYNQGAYLGGSCPWEFPTVTATAILCKTAQ